MLPLSTLLPITGILLCSLRSKFHYAIQSQTRSPTWSQTCVWVSCACRRPVESWSKAGCEPVCDQVRAISSCRDRSNLSATCFRSRDPKKLRAGRRPHELVGNRVCDQVCDLDSVMEFGPYSCVVVKYCDECVCLCVSLSVCPTGYLRNHTRDLYQFFVHVAYVGSSVLLWHVDDRPHSVVVCYNINKLTYLLTAVITFHCV